MNGWSRAGATLVGVAGAGALLWLAGQVARHSTGGYWAALGIVAAAGVVFALTQLRGRGGHPRAMFFFVFLPVFIVAGWVLIAMQPGSGNWFRGHTLAWSGDIGVGDVVRSLGTWVGVLAFGIGYTLGATLEPKALRTRRAVAPEPAQFLPAVHDPVAADEPMTADRRETSDDEATDDEATVVDRDAVSP
jgi:hypothetical protein